MRSRIKPGCLVNYPDAVASEKWTKESFKRCYMQESAGSTVTMDGDDTKKSTTPLLPVAIGSIRPPSSPDPCKSSPLSTPLRPRARALWQDTVCAPMSRRTTAPCHNSSPAHDEVAIAIDMKGCGLFVELQDLRNRHSHPPIGQK